MPVTPVSGGQSRKAIASQGQPNNTQLLQVGDRRCGPEPRMWKHLVPLTTASRTIPFSPGTEASDTHRKGPLSLAVSAITRTRASIWASNPVIQEVRLLKAGGTLSSDILTASSHSPSTRCPCHLGLHSVGSRQSPTLPPSLGFSFHSVFFGVRFREDR